MNLKIYHRTHRENTVIIKQKTGHRVMTKKVRRKNSVKSYQSLIFVSSVVNLLFLG